MGVTLQYQVAVGTNERLKSTQWTPAIFAISLRSSAAATPSCAAFVERLLWFNYKECNGKDRILQKERKKEQKKEKRITFTIEITQQSRL